MLKNSARTLLLLCILNSTFLVTKAQVNLVPNGSFEQMNNCPIVFGDFSVSNWNSPTDGSPDYFNSCNSGGASVPINALGNQPAVTGYAYVGLDIYDTFNTYSYREYIQVQLTQTLVFGQKYWVSFYVSLADSAMYAIQELGVYFSSVQVNDNSMDTALSFVPQIEFNDSVITGKNNWTKISGSFIASGNENYLIIGNFNRKQTTTANQVSGGNQSSAYYFVDEVCVSSDSSTCNQLVGISSILFNKALVEIYPNPIFDCLFVDNNENYPYELIIRNSLGQILYRKEGVLEKRIKIDANFLSEGLLFVEIKTKFNTNVCKIIKS